MGILILLVPATLALTGISVIAYIWACRNRQFDDLDAPPTKILFEDEWNTSGDATVSLTASPTTGSQSGSNQRSIPEESPYE